MTGSKKSKRELERDVQELQERLAIAEETLNAIRQGEVDALVISGSEGERIFTLQSADYPYRMLVEQMKEGAATLNLDGMILYCNHRLSSLIQRPLEQVIGSHFQDYLDATQQPLFESLMQVAQTGVGRGEFSLITNNRGEIPVQLSISNLIMNDCNVNCLIVTDLTERLRAEQALRRSEAMLADAQRVAHIGNWELDIRTKMMTCSKEVFHIYGLDSTQSGLTYTDTFQLFHPDDRENYQRAVERAITHGTPYDIDLRLLRNDGSLRWINQRGEAYFNSQETVIRLFGTTQDITEQKQVQEQIKTALYEKEVLLTEIHHRVKNNLQIVSSLLQMQTRRTPDRRVALILQDSQNRIASIALVHEKLYRSDDLARINLAQYIPSLTAYLFDTYQVNSKLVSLTTNIDSIVLDIDTAIPCGLIINELVSNSLKYAFPDNRKGKIQVEFHTSQEQVLTLVVRDNGIGIPRELDIENSHSLGLTLIQELVEQLEGTIEVKRHRGTEVKITFPLVRT